MTAFNALQLDEEHQNGSETEIREDSPDSFSSSSLDSVLSERAGVHMCRCCCNKDSDGCADEKETMNSSLSFSTVCCHHALNSEKLPYRFMSKQELLCFLNHEIQQERIAAESAANEAISMILRLQVEKAALQMEARHYQELLEARSLYDEETISQLRDVISSQEADRLILEKEIYECKQALQMFSECMQDEDRQVGLSGDEDTCKSLRITPNDSSPMQKIIGGISLPQACNENFTPLSLKENFNCTNVQSVEDVQQIDLAACELKEEAKTKYVVSIGSIDPLLNIASRDIALEPHAITHGTCLGMVDHQLHSSELEQDTVISKESWFDDVLRECWLGILTRLSSLQKQIQNLVQYQGCISNHKAAVGAGAGQGLLCATCLQDAFDMRTCKFSKSFSEQNLDSTEKKLPMVSDSFSDVSGLKNVIKGKGLSCAYGRYFSKLDQPEEVTNADIDSWREVLATIDSCLLSLEERFTTYQTTLHSLEIAMKAIREAAKMLNKNRGHSRKVLLKATNFLKEFISFTGLGCDILDISYKLVTDLTKATNLVESGCVGMDLGSKVKVDATAMTHDTLAASEEGLEKGSPVGQGDSHQRSGFTLSKLAFLWLSSLEWLSDEKCRAETALSGWDHI